MPHDRCFYFPRPQKPSQTFVEQPQLFGEICDFESDCSFGIPTVRNIHIMLQGRVEVEVEVVVVISKQHFSSELE